jgi:prepilin-type N-terminal cleavage/methylation domain-containing protein
MTRRGVTLVELLVALSIVALVATLATVAIAPARRAEQGTPDIIAAARREATLRGHSVTVSIVVRQSIVAVTANPDGSVAGPSAIGTGTILESLSGRDIATPTADSASHATP